MKKPTTLAIVMLMLFNGLLFAQQQNREVALLFKSGAFLPEENFESYLSHYSPVKNEIVNGRHYKIIQFYRIPKLSEREKIESTGITLLEYIPDNAWFASIPAGLDFETLADFDIRSIIPVEPTYKISSDLAEGKFPVWAMKEDNMVDLIVSVFRDVEPEYAVSRIIAAGFRVLTADEYSRTIRVRSNITCWEPLTQMPFVSFVEPVNPDPVPDNYTGRTLHHSNVINSDFTTGRHYDGTGVKIMLQDDGIIGPHIDYEGRIGQQYLTNNSGDHGDHVAGTIMGAGNRDPKGKGMASGATIYVYGAAPEYPGFNIIPTHYFNPGIRVSSTSYSDGCNAGYTSLTRTMDQQIRDYPSLMHVFSAGNEGTADCGYGAGNGWGNITGGHKAAKNVITVGNVNYIDDLSGSSSRGPAHDGRIKPDVCAKGSNVYSTTDPNDYTVKSGTSMSCPGTSGTLAQLYQAYRELNNGTDPTGGLMKAILLNSADDLGNAGPDFKFGWGRINALRAARILESYQYDSLILDQDDVMDFNLLVPDGLNQIKIMIYWTDYQATVNTTKALVNDLDMVVTDPLAESYYPWVLDHTPDPQALDAPAIRGIDHLNNMEQVTIDDPAGGNYTITVEGFAVPQGPQTCYIIWEYIVPGVALTYPYGGESFTPGETETLRWDASGAEENFILEYSFDGGNTWTLISDQVSPIRRYLDWDVPAVITGKGHFRISYNGYTSLNMVPFSIMYPPQNLDVDWSCASSFHIHWDEVFGATGYSVYLLGDKFMDSIGYTTQNSYIVEGVEAFEDNWFSVRAHGAADAVSTRAYAEMKSAGISNCYPTDAMVYDIPLAGWRYLQNCMDLSAIPLEVVIKNFGATELINFELSYQLNEGEITTEVVTYDLQPDSILNYTFVTPVNFEDTGSYVLKVWIYNDEDLNPENDTLAAMINVVEGAVMFPPSAQNFDQFEDCLTYPTCSDVVCDLIQGWINAENEVADDIDWRTWHGNTLTNGTGPSADHTTGTDEGKYLYLEPSVLCFNREARLISPCIDLRQAVQPVLHFWYHAFGDDIGRLQLDLLSGANISKDIIPPIIGEKGDEWMEVVVELSDYVGQVVSLRFKGFTGDGQKGDLAIDDIIVTDVTGVKPSEDLTDANILVFPNPGNGVYTLQITGETEPEGIGILVSDLTGRGIYQETVFAGNPASVFTFDISHAPQGIYMLTVIMGEKVLYTKVSKL